MALDHDWWWTIPLQADDQEGLQVLNHPEEWISMLPINGMFAVNLVQAFEIAKEGKCPAMIHRGYFSNEWQGEAF